MYKFGILFLSIAVACSSGLHVVPLYRESGVTGIHSRSGILNFTNSHNNAYFAKFNVGTPPQQFQAIFDTGSADTWVLSKKCSSDACKGHPSFDSLVSSSHIENGKSVTVYYGRGAITGSLSSDLVTIADLKTPLSFIEVTRFIENMNDNMRYEALIGMGFQSIGESNVPTIFDNLVTAQCIDPVFSFYFNREPNEDNGGVLILGGMNRTHYRGKLHYIPLVEPTYWMVALDDVHIGSLSLIKNNSRAIIDTGASRISAPSDVAWELYKALGATTSKSEDFFEFDQTVDCDTAASLPRLIFTIAGKTYFITYYDYISQSYRDSGPVCYVEIVRTDEPFWILGLPILGRYYSVFDAGQKRIGLADSVFPYIG